MPEPITIYLGTIDDCGCEMTAADWAGYIAIVERLAAERYPGSEVTINDRRRVTQGYVLSADPDDDAALPEDAWHEWCGRRA